MTVVRHPISLFLAILALSGLCHAQEGWDWDVRMFHPPDGSSFEEVRAIAETPDGALWFASWGSGLARLQDTQWTVYTEADGLPSRYVRAVVYDGDDGVWVGTLHGIAHVSNEGVHRIPAEALPFSKGVEINTACRMRDGRIWWGSSEEEIIVYHPPENSSQKAAWEGRFEWLYEIPAEWCGGIETIAEMRSGAVWIGLSEKGILQYDGSHWQHLSIDAIPPFRVKSILEDSDGAIWTAGSFLGGRFDGENWEPFDEQSETLIVVQSPRGEIITGNAYGMRWLKQDQWKNIYLERDYGNPLIRCIYFDSRANGWVGTKEGLFRLLKPKWPNIPSNAEFTFQSGHGFHADPQNPPRSINAANQVVEFNGSAWISIGQLPGERESNQFISQPRQGRHWIRNGDHVHLFDPGNGRVIQSVKLPPAPFKPLGLHYSNSGDLYIYGDGGAYRLAGERWTTYPTIAGYEPQTIRSMADLPSGRLVVCSFSDIEIWGPQSVEKLLDQHDQTPDHTISCVWPETEDRILCGTLGSGVILVTRETVRVLGSTEQLISGRIDSLFRASDGTLWAGTQRLGIASLRDNRWINFDYSDGLANTGILAFGEYPAGTIYAATRNYGVYRYQPDTDPPETKIDAYPETIPPNGNGVFSFSGYDGWNLTPNDALEYSWRIVDATGKRVIKPWSAFSSKKTIATPLLDPDTYQFEVRTADRDRNLDATPAQIKITVIPPFYERAEFLAPLASLLLLALLLTANLHRKHRELRASEENYRTIFDSVNDAIFIHDIHTGKVLDVNHHMTLMFGFTREEALERYPGYARSDNPDARDSDGRTWFEKAVQDRPQVFEWLSMKKNGELFWTEVALRRAPIGDQDRIVASVRDITERKEAEDALRESEENLAITLDSIGDAVIATDAKGRITRMNPVAEKLTGWSMQEALGRDLSEVFHIVNANTRRPIETPVSKVLREGKVIGMANTTMLIGRDQIERQIADSGAPIRNKDGEMVGVVLVFRDITEQHRLEEQLRQAQKMEAIGQLAGGVAHDFNNLLGGIMGYADLLIHSLKKKPDQENLGSFAQAIQDTGQRAADLTAQLLAFSRRSKLNLEALDIHDVIRKVTGLLEHTIDRRIEIIQQFTKENPVVLGDPSQLQNALLNLAVNARDAMPEGGKLTFRTAVLRREETQREQLIDSEVANQFLEIQVCDTGIGIPPKVLKRIFEPFFTTKGVGKGTGLGLAAVYGVVQAHHGDISVQSELGQGTLFSIYLPLVETTVNPLCEVPKVELVRGNGRILLVDDEAVIRNMTEQMLHELGYTVSTAGDGEEALKIYLADQGQFDLVILDMVMPRMNGEETLMKLQEIDPNVKVLIASGYSANIESEYLNNHIQGFVQKPFMLDDFARKVAAAMGNLSPGVEV